MKPKQIISNDKTPKLQSRSLVPTESKATLSQAMSIPNTCAETRASGRQPPIQSAFQESKITGTNNILVVLISTSTANRAFGSQSWSNPPSSESKVQTASNRVVECDTLSNATYPAINTMSSTGPNTKQSPTARTVTSTPAKRKCVKRNSPNAVDLDGTNTETNFDAEKFKQFEMQAITRALTISPAPLVHPTTTCASTSAGTRRTIDLQCIMDSSPANTVPNFCQAHKKSFASKASFIEHMRHHAPDHMPYVCEVCEKKFVYNQSLKRHKLLHSDEKPFFVCETCYKTFARADALKRHLLIHSGEKPFKCHICNRCFQRNYILQAHISRHTCEKKVRRYGM